MFGVGSDLDYGVGTRPHQQVVDRAFVLMGDIGNLFGQREDQVEVPHRQQFRLARRQPCLGRAHLTLWAVSIPTGVVADVLARAVFAACNVTSKRRRAAALDGVHHLELIKADMARMCHTICRSVGAEDIRNL